MAGVAGVLVRGIVGVAVCQYLEKIFGKEKAMERENMWICEHCLMAIESREGNQATLRHWVDEDDEVESKCDWCEEDGYSILYELI